MYNPTLLQSGFQGIVGLLQANSPQVPAITAPLTTSESGIFVQDKHPIVTLENIWQSCPDFNPNNWPSWVSMTSYAALTVVAYSGVLYQAINPVTSATNPSADPTNWSVYNPFSAFLQRKMNQGVTNMISEVIKIFKLQETAKAIIERQQLFRGGGSRNSAIVPDGSFVGFEILVQQAEALMLILDMIGLQFTQAQSLNIYIYHTSKESSAIYILPVTTAGASDFSWVATAAAKLMYLVQNTAGTWIVGYFEGDLIGGNQAISRTWDCTSPPCGGCSDADLLMYNRWSRYTSFRNIKIPPIGLNGRALPNTQYATYGGMTNWGLNFSMTVRCDLTDFILYSKFLYADAYAMQMTLEFMKLIASSTRINPDMAQIKNQARAELNLEQKSTFINQYWDSIKALKADMSGFSESCQPCDQKNNRKTAKWRSI